ncbi:hypothetical protein Q8A73_017415 [Channa argus]|nr:hypothetical protein Q8A73_017415 [Channa argus]
MGSTGSRPRLHKVVPCNSLQQEREQLKPQWTLPALSVTLEKPSLGSRKTTLPPLKQEKNFSTLSESCFTGSLPQKKINNSSNIRSHPPRKPQALQPLTLQIGHKSANNPTGMTGDCIEGAVSQSSTTGAYLEAQTALIQQALPQRRAHLRQARELRRHKVTYKVNIGCQNTDGVQMQKLVRRPTERDIVWHESTGKPLDPSFFLEPKSLALLWEEKQSNQPKTVDTDQHDRAQNPQNRQKLRAVHKSGYGGWILDKEL